MRFVALWLLMATVLAQAAPTLVTIPLASEIEPHELYPRTDSGGEDFLRYSGD